MHRSIQGAGSVIGITTYPSGDQDIYAAENAYTALENQPQHLPMWMNRQKHPKQKQLRQNRQ